jgi:PAS domain S-box-containing protein
MSTHRPSPDRSPKWGSWAEDRLRDRGASLSELEDLLVTGGAAVIATDLDGVITHWSAGAERLYGWSGDEAIGRPVIDLLVAQGDRRAAEEIMDSVRRTGTWEGGVDWEGEFDMRRKDGSLVLAYVRHTLIKDDAGRPVGILGLSMDAAAPPRDADQPAA